jgi:hypothetical protein
MLGIARIVRRMMECLWIRRIFSLWKIFAQIAETIIVLGPKI